MFSETCASERGPFGMADLNMSLYTGCSAKRVPHLGLMFYESYEVQGARDGADG